ncbi:MAG: polyphosphate kinase 1 [Bacteroidia bacterium]|nr:polyphosphate kinase 1 [Bacteroidia bacterium]
MAENIYFERDLSWLSFNYRVLLESTDRKLPLYERIKFLAIYAANLDEFFHVRVAYTLSLVRLQKQGEITLDFDAEKLLEKIHAEVNRQQEVFGRLFNDDILEELHKNKINLLLRPPKEAIHKEFVETFFHDEVRAYLHPELLRKNKIVHFLRDDALYLAVKLRNQPRDPSKVKDPAALYAKRIRYALIQVPTHYFSRFVELPRIGEQYYYMLLDDVINCNLSKIFPGYDILGCHNIKLTRNADLIIEDEFSGDLVEKIQKSLRKRKTGLPARFLYDKQMGNNMLQYLRDTFSITKRELMPGGRHHSFKDFFNFPNPIGARLERKPTPPVPHRELESYPFLIEAIKQKNWILHFPYHTYDYVVRFLNQAAIDPQVESIRVTQYRVASNSAIVNALVRAAQNGKQVTVFVELKARFDEAANLASAKEMKEAGANIIYSIPGLKVHAKVAMVTRIEGHKKVRYAFLSTGNFNEKTARIYADHGFFTKDEEITNELKEVFLHLEDQSYQPPQFRKLMVGQFNLKGNFISLIDREITHARAGRKAEILIKLNNLEDRIMVDKLYEAGQAGVKIRIIVRGICCLRPGLPGVSENISVIRLVDQFLEHARVLVFYNDGDMDMYLTSADWMRRNLNRRIELAFPIWDPELKREVMEILRLQWSDNTKAVKLNENIENIPITRAEGEPAVRAQMDIYARVKDGKL